MCIKKDHKGLYLTPPNNHSLQAHLVEEEQNEMIPKRFIYRIDFHKLTRAEAVAFVIFELKEKIRHREDIKVIREDVKELCKIHDINGMELIGLYDFVEEGKQSSEVTGK